MSDSERPHRRQRSLIGGRVPPVFLPSRPMQTAHKDMSLGLEIKTKFGVQTTLTGALILIADTNPFKKKDTTVYFKSALSFLRLSWKLPKWEMMGNPIHRSLWFAGTVVRSVSVTGVCLGVVAPLPARRFWPRDKTHPHLFHFCSSRYVNLDSPRRVYLFWAERHLLTALSQVYPSSVFLKPQLRFIIVFFFFKWLLYW